MILELSWDGMGFTSNKKHFEQGLDAEEAKALTARLKAEKALPANVLGITGASTDPDGKENGEWKLFVKVALVVNVSSEGAAFAMEPPEDLLRMVVNSMMGADAFDELDLRGSFEILEVNPVDNAVAEQFNGKGSE